MDLSHFATRKAVHTVITSICLVFAWVDQVVDIVHDFKDAMILKWKIYLVYFLTTSDLF